MQCSRWISVCVDTFDHQMFEGDTYSKRDAWLWLIAHAAWKDKTINNKGRSMLLQRGQVVAGRSFLAKTWGWSEKAVRGFLTVLERESMIEFSGQSDGHVANVVTICNYDVYQMKQKEEGQSEGQSRASQGPVKGQTLTSNTILQKEVGERIAGATVEIREGEEAHPHGVLVNCETIRHANFTISLPAIELGIAGRLARPAVKTRCLAHALQWAAEIDGGKKPRDVIPGKIANFLSASIMGEINREAVAGVRRSKAEITPVGAARSGDWRAEKHAEARAIFAKLNLSTRAPQ